MQVAINNKSILWSYLVVLLFSQFPLTPTHAQSFDANIGWYGGLNRDGFARKYGNSGLIIRRQASFTFGLYFRRLLDLSHKDRFGLRLHMHRMESSPQALSNNRFSQDPGRYFAFTSFLLSYQRRFYKKQLVMMFYDLCGGLAIIGSKSKRGPEPCESPFCHFPEARLILVPRAFYFIRLHRGIALQLTASYNILLNADSEIAPFSPGPALSIGLSFEAEQRQ